MNIKSIALAFVFLLFTNAGYGNVAKPLRVNAPDKKTQVELGTDDLGTLQYRVYFLGKIALDWSDLGLEVNNVPMTEKTAFSVGERSSHFERFAWPLGESDTITNSYKELILNCINSTFRYKLIVRVFNGSVAFRYEIPPQATPTGISIRHEKTTFTLKEPFVIYQYNHESVFTPTSIDTLVKTCDFPATLRTKKFYISIGEAVNERYTKAELMKGDNPHSLQVAFVRDTAVKMENAIFTPWRTISISQTAVGLHEFSTLFLKLAPSLQKEVPKWIKPGKLIRSQLNTQSGLECIDFAAKHSLQYILFDAGWYGAEFRGTSDPTQVIPDIDMPKVIHYGKEHGIGVILYVNYVGLKAKLDTLLTLYKEWGVRGFKFGFVDGLTQNGLTWLSSAIKKVNDSGFVLDIHDNYKPTGLSRMYPALLTQEGIRGDENSPDAFHTTVLPFTRFLAGPADFTFCFPNEKNSFSKNLKVSMAQQLALTVVYFSPLQALYWYGKPLDYTNDAELEFFDQMPTVWNETRYLAGDIGRNISVARRNGSTWFVGNAAGMNDWKSSIKLDFLTKGKRYTATVFEDDGAGSIRKRNFSAMKGDVFSFEIKAKGGQAILFK